jgi:tRNA U34 2-thiouridine synthase MnmA/TrmU
LVRIRHLGSLLKAQVNFENNIALINLQEKVFGIAPGQSCVFYNNNSEVIGGGVIKEVSY